MPFCLNVSDAGAPPLFCGIFAVLHCRSLRGHPLPLPLGEVAERSEDGEGKQIDLIIQKAARLYLPQAAAYRFFPLSHLAVTALPEGEPRGCATQQSIKNGAV